MSFRIKSFVRIVRMKNCYASFVAILSFRFFVFGNIVIGPKLECNEEGLRIHFSPTGSFSGHVYVKGYFFSQYCHLDYSSYLISHPFFFHIPYKSECNVKKERSLEPPGINYNVIVVVQNHKMFLTDADQAYSINCFFRENRTDAGTILSHSLQVSDLNVTNIDNDPVQTQPICSYQVLSGSENGSSVQFASIGDLLYHKWSCESNEMGMLVHTCIVKDAVQNSFTIIDNRGCITDKSLLQPLNYSSSLNSVYAPISAFKFADQMSVFFSCQITLCRKVLNGCEGITPPVCNYIKLPTEGGPIMPVLTPNRQPSIPLVNLIEDTIQGRPFDVTDENLFQAQSQPQILNQPSNHMIAQPQTLSQAAQIITQPPNQAPTQQQIIPDSRFFGGNFQPKFSGVTPKPQLYQNFENIANYQRYEGNPESYAQRNYQEIRNTRDIIQGVLQRTTPSFALNRVPISSAMQGNFFQEPTPLRAKISDTDKTITLDVVADQLIILSKDDAIKANGLSNPNIQTIQKTCPSTLFPLITFIALSIISFVIAIIAILCQRKYYEKKIKKWQIYATMNLR